MMMMNGKVSLFLINKDDDDAVKLEELLFDMKLDDKTEKQIEKENESAVDEFISKLEKVKISK